MSSRGSVGGDSSEKEKGTSAGPVKDIWAMALKERDAQKSLVEEERTLLFTGPKGSGKTTIIDRFLDKAPEAPKPTVALEYKYSRKSKGLDQAKDVAHIWELAGGTTLTKLIDAVITSSTIRSVAVVFVVDLSRPADIWPALDTLMKAVRARIDKIGTDMAAKDPKAPQQLKKKAWQKYGEDHPDKEWLTPMPIPLIIVGSKHDLFMSLETEKRKMICNALRFAAHVNGASLLYVSEKDETLLTRLRAILSYLAFKTTAPSRVVTIDPARPLVVPVGTDSLSQIGPPPLPPGDVSSLSAKRPQEMWQAVLHAAFPPDATRQDAVDPATNPKYAEAAIDAMRAQKDEELEKYKRDAERRAREQAHRAEVEEGDRDREREHGERERERGSRGEREKDRGDKGEKERSSRHRDKDSSRASKK